MLLGLLALLAGLVARADDRPFLRTTTAAVDDDNARTLELHLGRLSGKKIGASRLQMGYSLTPQLNVEVELESIRDRFETSSTRDRELALWVSWVEPQREGWGLSSRMSIGQERENAQDTEVSKGHTYARGVGALSLIRPDLWLHANLGLQWDASSQRTGHWRGVWSLAMEQTLHGQTHWFAELAATGQQSLAFAGLRQWLRKGKVAMDLGGGRQTLGTSLGQTPFVSISLSLYEIPL